MYLEQTILRWLTNQHKSEPLWVSNLTLIIGKPKATDTYTVEQLEGMGMIGVYTNA